MASFGRGNRKSKKPVIATSTGRNPTDDRVRRLEPKRVSDDTNGEYFLCGADVTVWVMAANSQTVPIAPTDPDSSFSAVPWTGRDEAAKVWTLCLEHLQSAMGRMRNLTLIQPLEKIVSKRDLSAESSRASATAPMTFSKRPHNKIGFALAWVCECGSFSLLRSSDQSQDGVVERQCPACGETQRIAYCRLLCEPRNDTAEASGKWIYPEVAMESSETDGRAGRDYDWSFYDPIYFQGDRDRDASSCALALRS